MPARFCRLLVTVAAASSTLAVQAHGALADACGRSAHASTGVLGDTGSSFVEMVAPALVVGLTAFAVRRWRRG